PAGNRVVSIKVGDAPLGEHKIYRLATNDFMARGGDGYSVFRDAKPLLSALDAPLLSNPVIAPIKTLGTVRTGAHGRIGLKGATAAGEIDRSATDAMRYPTGRSSVITLPSFGRLPGATSFTSPPSFVTARSVATTASCKGAAGVAHSAIRVMTSCSPARATTSRNRPTSGWRWRIGAPGAGRTNMPLTLVAWSARPIQPTSRILVRPQRERPGITAERSPVASRIIG